MLQRYIYGVVYAYNAVGSVIANTDSTGAVSAEMDFDAYGQITRQTGSSENDLLFSTKERDFSIGLDNHGFRFYDPLLGKYITRDPSGYPDGFNNQIYAKNNPINWIDPLGLEMKDPDAPEWHHTVKKNDPTNKSILKGSDIDINHKDFGIMMRAEDHRGAGGKSLHNGSDWDAKMTKGLQALKDKGKLTHDNVKTLVEEMKGDKKYSKWINRSFDAVHSHGEWHKPKATGGLKADQVRDNLRTSARKTLAELKNAENNGGSTSKINRIRGGGRTLLKVIGVVGFVGSTTSAFAIGDKNVTDKYRKFISTAQNPKSSQAQIQASARDLGLELTLATNSIAPVMGVNAKIEMDDIKNNWRQNKKAMDKSIAERNKGKSWWDRTKDAVNSVTEHF